MNCCSKIMILDLVAQKYCLKHMQTQRKLLAILKATSTGNNIILEGVESRKFDLTAQSDFFFHFFFSFYDIIRDCFGFFNNSVGSCFWTSLSSKIWM